MLHVGTKNLSSNKPSEQRFQEVLHLIELLKLNKNPDCCIKYSSLWWLYENIAEENNTMIRTLWKIIILMLNGIKTQTQRDVLIEVNFNLTNPVFQFSLGILGKFLKMFTEYGSGVTKFLLFIIFLISA